MKSLFFLLLCLIPILVSAQGVAINADGSAPENSAILDIKSESKGLLIPRMTSAQRTGIISAAPGLTVFDMDTYSYWMYRGELNGGWRELMYSDQAQWQRNGNFLYNVNPGGVSIGTNSTFDAELKLNGVSPRFAFLHNNVQKGILRLTGDDFKMGTYPGNPGDLVFNPQGVDRIWINPAGQMGIGTSSPSSLLTINGTNPVVQLRHLNSNKGILKANGNDLTLGTNATNLTGNLVFHTKEVDRMVIDESGRVGIGTSTPTSILTVNGTEPIIQMRNDNEDKGFIQLVGDNIKIGTNISNYSGGFIVRTSGSDRLFVNYAGKMGLNVVPNPSSFSFSIGPDDYNTTGIELSDANGNRKSAYSFNGTNCFLTASVGSLYLYRNSISPFIAYSDGSFGLGGSEKATGYKLSVNGKAIATEFTAMPIGNWPDYVFDEGYTLRPLDEVKAFIRDNHHLPNIPSAAQIRDQGIELGEMSRKLMEKVEELTLYILQQQEQIDALKQVLVENTNQSKVTEKK